MSDSDEKMGFNATWSMGVGGMIGGGIFSVLGVVVATAGAHAWLSFVLAGLIALCSADSYNLLAEKFGEGGGSFTFLRDINRDGFAGSVSWIVIAGYMLTLSVYAFTFGHYVANVFDLGDWFPRAAGAAIIVIVVTVNLRGVGDAALVEIIAVWVKLFVLVGLGVWGIAQWSPENLTLSGDHATYTDALVGAAMIFMAYEGFELLSFDYDEVENARKTVPMATITSVLTVIVVYVLVLFGATMLVGADALVEKEEVALAVAGQRALGAPGLWIITIAAALSTTSAINATLFAVARLVRHAARDGELPTFFEHRNKVNVPDRAILLIGALAAGLAVVGSLSQLVSAASLGFLFNFTVVNVLAAIEVRKRRWVSILGALGGTAAFVVLLVRQFQTNITTVVVFSAIVLFATAGRHFLMHRGE